jgi:3-dehydrosphinganine reductase
MTRLAPFAGCAAIIFGASEGTGLALAEALAPHMRGVALISRSREKLDAAATRVRTKANALAVHAADVTDAASVQRAFDASIAELGPASIVINCAGAAHPGYFEDLPAEVFAEQMQRHLIGTVNVCKAAIPHLKTNTPSRLVTTASVLGLVGMFGYSAYAASKHAVVGLVRSLRSEYAGTGLRISALCPPAIDTPGFAAENTLKPAEVLKVEMKAGMLTPAEVAAALIRALPRGPELILPKGAAAPHLLQRFAPGLLEILAARPRA